MRLDCPKCGAKGNARAYKTPIWRCSPARSNGGCGYEWDDPNYNDPNMDYRYLDKRDADIIRDSGGIDWWRYWWLQGYRSTSEVEEVKRSRKLETTERRRQLNEEEELRRLGSLGEPMRCPACGLQKVISTSISARHPRIDKFFSTWVWQCVIEPTSSDGRRGCGYQWPKLTGAMDYYPSEGHWRRRPIEEAPEPTPNADFDGSKGEAPEPTPNADSDGLYQMDVRQFLGMVGTIALLILFVGGFIFLMLQSSNDDPRPPDRPADSYPRG